MVCSTETIQLIKMTGPYLEPLGAVGFQQLYFHCNTYMNYTSLRNVYGLIQMQTMTYVDIQEVNLLFLDIHGGTL